MKPTKNHFLISLLATKVTSATEPMAMMSVHEMWFEVSSVARPCAGVPISVTFMPRKMQPNLWKSRGSTFQPGRPRRVMTNWSGMPIEHERHVDEDEEQRAQNHFLPVRAPSGTA